MHHAMLLQVVKDSGVMDTAAAAEASHLAGKVSEAAKGAAQTVQGATSVVWPHTVF